MKSQGFTSFSSFLSYPPIFLQFYNLLLLYVLLKVQIQHILSEFYIHKNETSHHFQTCSVLIWVLFYYLLYIYLARLADCVSAHSERDPQVLRSSRITPLQQFASHLQPFRRAYVDLLANTVPCRLFPGCQLLNNRFGAIMLNAFVQLACGGASCSCLQPKTSDHGAQQSSARPR